MLNNPKKYKIIFKPNYILIKCRNGNACSKYNINFLHIYQFLINCRCFYEILHNEIDAVLK
jgi:hypothetical protein